MSDQSILDKQNLDKMNGYAKLGDTKSLYNSIEHDPHILQTIEKISFVHTPLHAAAAHGQTTFAIEILTLLPSLGKKLNTDGLSPLHVALQSHKKETALALVRFDNSLVRVRGFEGFTPLHYAAKFYPDMDVLASFLLDCQESINDLNNRFQSAVHLVVESEAEEAINLVLRWLMRTSMEHVLGVKDVNKNTALHLAAQHGCVEAVQIMVKIAKLHKKNSENKTPLDVAMDSGNEQVVQILRKAGAKRAVRIPPKQSNADYLASKLNILETWLRGFCFMLKDLTLEMRNIVLIVAVLIATATYQAVLQPPGGVYSGDAPGPGAAPAPAPIRLPGRRALASPAASPAVEGLLKFKSKVGKMMMGENDYIQFMPANTVAFTLSMVTIICVLYGRPYNIILHTCLVFLAYSYLVAMESISEDSHVTGIMFVLSWSVLSTAFVVKMVYYVVKAMFEDVWWLPRCGVMWHNASNQERGTTCVRGMKLARKLRRQAKLIQRLTV